MNIIWAGAIIAFMVLEAATAGLASIWFAIGAVFGLIVALLGAPVWLQVAVFSAVSIITLVLTRPLALKYVNAKSQPTNADRIIGTTAIVTETIDNLKAVGIVSASGKVWTARSADGEVIENGALVTVQKIEGVKLIVSVKN